MKKWMSLATFCLGVFASTAGAHDYPLQFTPNPGARGLVVAGYEFQGNHVVGTCSYHTVSGASGRGAGHAPVGRRFGQTCRWDMYGNLISVSPGAPAVPTVVSTKGTQVIYAVDANGDSTGTDLKHPERGFVSTPGPHYTWLTPNSDGVLTSQMVYTMTVTLESDGDVPVNITNVKASASGGVASVKSTTCDGQIDVGKTCSVTVTYDPTKLSSPKGLASDTLRIDLTSNAGDAHDFIQNFTIVLPQKL